MKNKKIDTKLITVIVHYNCAFVVAISDLLFTIGADQYYLTSSSVEVSCDNICVLDVFIHHH